MSLRPYQSDVLDRAREQVRGGRRSVLVVSPTGTGKSRLIAAACAGHVAQGGTVLVVAPRREIAWQLSATLRDAGLVLERDVFVRTIQQLIARGAVVPRVSMCVYDEAHHYVAEEWGRLRELLPDALVLGFSATPSRGDGVGLGGMFDALVEAISVRDATAQGYLVPCDVLRPERPLKSSELAQDPVDAYRQHASGKRAVIFARSVELAQQYALRLGREGVEARAVWGAQPSDIRDQAIEDFAAGRVTVLTNHSILGEGVDIPAIEAVILARTFGTPASYLQAVGRALRPSEGKSRALVLDLTGASHVHGDPDEPREWSLDGRACRRKGDELAVRWCKVCGAPVTADVCGTCGYDGAEGFTSRPPRVLGLALDRFKRFREQGDDEAARTLARWMRVGRSKGYREGWALAKFSAVYGRQPSWELRRLARQMG